jgi:hypothetical protein
MRWRKLPLPPRRRRRSNYRFRVLKPLAEALGIERLNFQILRRTMATQAQSLRMVGSVFLMLMKGGRKNSALWICHKMPQAFLGQIL